MTITDVLRMDISFTTDAFATPSWVQVSNIGTDAARRDRGLRQVQWSHGRGGPLRMWASSSLSATFNNLDGDWDSENDYVGHPFGADNLLRNRRVRLRVSDDDFVTDRDVFHGFIDDIAPEGTGYFSTATVTASDMLRVLGEFDLDDVERSEEWAGDRIAALITAAGIPAGFVGTIQNGTVKMPAATYGESALAAIAQCAKADGGFFWWDHSTAQLEYRERWATGSKTEWSVQQHAFTETATTNVTRFLGAPSLRTLGSFEKVSRVTASSASGTGLSYVYDTTGANEIKSTSTTNSHNLDISYDAMVEYVPEHVHDALAFDGERVRSITVRTYPGNDEAITAMSEGRWDPINRVEVQHRPVGFASDFNYQAHIETVNHAATADQWTSVLEFSPFSTQLQTEMSSVFYNYGDVVTSSDLGAF